METSLRSGASFYLAKKPVKCTLKSRKLSIELQFLKALVIKSDDFFYESKYYLHSYNG